MASGTTLNLFHKCLLPSALCLSSVSTKRIYKIDLRGATDVSHISLTDTNDLPSGVQPISKSSSPFIDIATTLQANGQIVPEKTEALAIGPKLANGFYAIIVGTDNDFSITQNDSGTQFDVCTGGTQVSIDSGCSSGQTLISTYIYSFKVSAKELQRYIPPFKIGSRYP